MITCNNQITIVVRTPLLEKYYKRRDYFVLIRRIQGGSRSETSGTAAVLHRFLNDTQRQDMGDASTHTRGDYTRFEEVLRQQKNVDDLNIISDFLSASEPIVEEEGTVYMLAGNAVLATTTALFDHLQTLDQSAALVISGGLGHSTQYLYEEIRTHSRFYTLFDSIKDLPEALVLEDVLSSFWPSLVEKEQGSMLRILAEESSTNCGSNATETKRVLDEAEIKPRRIVLVQDPTMSLRTKMSLIKAYEGEEVHPEVVAWTIVPRLGLVDGKPTWLLDGTRKMGSTSVEMDGLWSLERFVSLVMGEIPRLRDDKAGYGPKGTGFIGHVDIPDEVERAWQALDKVLRA